MYQAKLLPSTTARPFSIAQSRNFQQRISHAVAILFSIVFLALLFFPSQVFAGVCDGQSIIFCDDFETDQGWITNFDGADTATAGLWERAFPERTEEVTAYDNNTTGNGQPLWVEYRAGDGGVLQRRAFIYDGFSRVDTVSTTLGSEQFAEQIT